MKEFNLYIMDMTSFSNTSGVDRYIENLLYGLSKQSFCDIYRIQLLWDSSLLFPKEMKEENYIKLIIPMPQNSKSFINREYWAEKYSKHIFSLISYLFYKERKHVIHIHTLNLIDLALFIKKQVGCKIITHLHCIPWKNYYNINRQKFNDLYSYNLMKEEEIDGKCFLISSFEYASYYFPDRIICVTDNARNFIQKTLKISKKVIVISNGIKDFAEMPFKREDKNVSALFKILFVGNFSESKGGLFLLEALHKIRKKDYKIQLNIVGNCNIKIQNYVASECNNLAIHLLGKVTFGELKTQYLESDIGVIVSLQEQCSYVAIEMAMFGLPIVTTAVDGLDEIFEDNVNALKVNTIFSKLSGLRVDVDMLAEKIINLIENRSLREKLGRNARKMYEKRFILEKMIRETTKIYREIINE